MAKTIQLAIFSVSLIFCRSHSLSLLANCMLHVPWYLFMSIIVYGKRAARIFVKLTPTCGWWLLELNVNFSKEKVPALTFDRTISIELIALQMCMHLVWIKMHSMKRDQCPSSIIVAMSVYLIWNRTFHRMNVHFTQIWIIKRKWLITI